MPNPINQAMRPKIMTPLSRENIFSSSIQAVKGSIKDTEELKAAKEKYGYKKLCLSGGVALNCSMNGKIEQSRIFDEIYVVEIETQK